MLSVLLAVWVLHLLRCAVRDVGLLDWLRPARQPFGPIQTGGSRAS